MKIEFIENWIYGKLIELIENWIYGKLNFLKINWIYWKLNFLKINWIYWKLNLLKNLFFGNELNLLKTELIENWIFSKLNWLNYWYDWNECNYNFIAGIHSVDLKIHSLSIILLIELLICIAEIHWNCHLTNYLLVISLYCNWSSSSNWIILLNFIEFYWILLNFWIFGKLNFWQFWSGN